jgi:gas vesicle protein
MQLRMPKIQARQIKTNGIAGTVDDVRRMVSEGAEQVAEQVAHVAEQLGTEAGKLGQDAGKEAGKVGRDVSAEAAKLGKEWRTTGEVNLRALGKDIRALGKDIRQLRVTREKRGSDVMPGIALLAGLGGGMAVMYFFDPEQGRRRRALLRDQAVKWTRISRERLSGRAEDLRNRTIGLTHEARSALSSGTQRIGDEPWEGIGESAPDASDELERTDQAVRSEVGY